jgi:hypothetical protein
MTDPHQTEVFERVVRPHFDRLYRLAWRLTGAKPEAEDLFQELLIKAFGMLDELVHIEEPGSWLCRVMYNQFDSPTSPATSTPSTTGRGWRNSGGWMRHCNNSARNTVSSCCCMTPRGTSWRKSRV